MSGGFISIRFTSATDISCCLRSRLTRSNQQQIDSESPLTFALEIFHGLDRCILFDHDDCARAVSQGHNLHWDPLVSQ